MDAKTRKRGLCGSDNEAEATAARRKLIELLRKHGRTWNDLDAILAIDVPPAQPPPDPRDVWNTPVLLEVCIGLEINGYLPAEF